MKVLWEELSKCFGKEKHQWNWGASTGKTSLQQSLFEPIRIDTRHWKTNVCSWLEISPTRFVNSLCFFLLMSMPFSLSRIASFWLHISNPNFPYFDILQNRCCRWFLPCLFFFFFVCDQTQRSLSKTRNIFLTWNWALIWLFFPQWKKRPGSINI